NRALSAAEIAAIYNAGSDGKCPDVPPTIAASPQSQTVTAGDNATFSVNAAGSPPLSYQWRFNGTNINGATDTSYTVNSAQATDAGNYSVMVTNASGSATSAVATLTVLVPGTACTPAPAGLAAWWKAEGNATDSAGTNNGSLFGGAGFAAGEVGQAFSFDGSSAYVQAPDSSLWNLGTNAFTIELWANFASGTGAQTLVAHDAGSGGNNKWIFWFSSGRLGLHVNGSTGIAFILSSLFTPTLNQWYHLAVARNSTNYQFFINGAPFSTTNNNIVIPAASTPLTIGNAEGGNFFSGLMDEVSIYNRALTASQIASVYTAESFGKCALPPTILSQPQSLTVVAGSNATFGVWAVGLPPLSYQWRFNGTNIPGATNTSLTLSNVQSGAVGAYSVRVTNSIGVTNSASANLDVRYLFVYGNGQLLLGTNYSYGLSVAISMQSLFMNGSIFYTLNGSQPSFASTDYTGAFTLTNNATLRAITYSADFMQSSEAAPIYFTILPTYSLSTRTPGGGTISVSPPNGPYASNTTATVTATASNGWTFLGWQGDASGSNPMVNVTMTRNKIVQALFGTPLSKTVAGNGSVSIYPSAALYPYGTVVRFSATPQPGSYFGIWGNAASGSSNPLYFTVTNANQTVSSLFASLSAGQASLAVAPDGFGRVTINPEASVYTLGANVTLTATPDSGQTFLGWSGDASGTTNPLLITMNQSKVITAGFTRRPILTPKSLLDGPTADGFRFTLTGEFGGHYRIDVSANLAGWSQFAVITNTYGQTQLTDPAGATQGRINKGT
ncbi:MAG: hypothetical protein DME25_09070, partial [Verrucomicrobia bacterium]